MVTITSVTIKGGLQIFLGHFNSNAPKVLSYPIYVTCVKVTGFDMQLKHYI